jgi:aminoglycoside phosphotransferase (APT) family kinase protein
VARQLRRWSGQFEQTREAGVAEPGAVEAVGDELARRIPAQRDAGVVHGDYRLDNVVVRADGSVAAVLDWELCTLGEPLADVGTFLDYWEVPPDGRPFLDKVPASALDGFSGAGELAERYAEATGRDVSEIAYFRAFGYWRLACILQGVYARYQGGAAAGDPAAVDGFPSSIARLATLAADTLAAR